ncbi:hypothetical protein HAX54_002593 [Datura stramonium]|uniref:Uncharacterized protein n=1 Tax=Datura stramonium TaxID=4076 RepID=A0ABS8WTU2_DATST|nr:hypothetical protein [Datura stramonium]
MEEEILLAVLNTDVTSDEVDYNKNEKQLVTSPNRAEHNKMIEVYKRTSPMKYLHEIMSHNFMEEEDVSNKENETGPGKEIDHDESLRLMEPYRVEAVQVILIQVQNAYK